MSKETKMNPASAETRAALGEVMTVFEAFKAANDERLAELDAKAAGDVLLEEKLGRIDRDLTQQKSALDRLLSEQARPALARGDTPADPGWAAYMRRGDASGLHEGKSASAGVDGDGGYVVPERTERRIDRLLTEASPIRAIGDAPTRLPLRDLGEGHLVADGS